MLLEESRNSKSRKECGQIVFGGGSSAPTAKTAMCSRGSSRVKELEEQLDLALEAKLELSAQVNEHKINSAQSTLRHLEDYFTCPL